MDNGVGPGGFCWALPAANYIFKQFWRSRWDQGAKREQGVIVGQRIMYGKLPSASRVLP